MNSRQRWGGGLGVLSGVLFFVAVIMLFGLPSWKVSSDHPDPARHVTDFYNSSGHRGAIVFGAYLLVLSGLAFMGFLMHLRRHLREAGGDSVVIDVLTGAGLVYVALSSAGALTMATIAADIGFGQQMHPSPELAALLPQLGYPLLLIGGMFSGALVVAMASMTVVRSGGLPRWLGYAGFVVALGLLFAAIFLPMILWVLWLIIAGIAVATQAAPVPEMA